MSFLAGAWAETAPVADVYERAIITLFAHRADPDGTGCFPSIKSLAEFAVCDDRSVKRRLAALKKRRLIAEGDQKLAQYIDPRYRPKVYDLLIPYSWYSPDQMRDVQRDRAKRGLTPLLEDERPAIAPPPPRASRADAGQPRQAAS